MTTPKDEFLPAYRKLSQKASAMNEYIHVDQHRDQLLEKLHHRIDKLLTEFINKHIQIQNAPNNSLYTAMANVMNDISNLIDKPDERDMHIEKMNQDSNDLKSDRTLFKYAQKVLSFMKFMALNPTAFYSKNPEKKELAQNKYKNIKSDTSKVTNQRTRLTRKVGSTINKSAEIKKKLQAFNDTQSIKDQSQSSDQKGFGRPK